MTSSDEFVVDFGDSVALAAAAFDSWSWSGSTVNCPYGRFSWWSVATGAIGINGKILMA